MKINLDLKSVLIIILLVFSTIFFSIWYFKGTEYKKEYNKLELEFRKLQQTRDSLEKVNVDLKKDFNKIQIEISKRDSHIRSVEKELEKSKNELKIANQDIEENNQKLEKIKKKIEELKNNPIKREDDDLINSLREKLK